MITGRVGGDVRALKLSHGAYSVLHEVLALAGSRLTRSEWERYWVLWLASHDLSLYGHNIADYDVGELPWEFAPTLVEGRAFLRRVVDAASAGLVWEMLGCDPPFVRDHLGRYGELVAALRPEDVELETPFRPDVPDAFGRRLVGLVLFGSRARGEG